MLVWGEACPGPLGLAGPESCSQAPFPDPSWSPGRAYGFPWPVEPGLGAGSGLCHRDEPGGSEGGPGLSLLMGAKCLACIQGHPCLPLLTAWHRALTGPVEGTRHKSKPVPSFSVWKCTFLILELLSLCLKHTSFWAPNIGRTSMDNWPIALPLEADT